MPAKRPVTKFTASGGINFGAAPVDDIKFGAAQVDKVMFGSTLVWPVAAVFNKTLDYDFKQNWGTPLATAILTGPTPTFTRASDAWGVDESGVVRAAGGNDLPRFTHDGANANAALGLLIEGARTNLFDGNTSDIWPQGGNWSEAYSNGGTPVLAPDGTNTALEFPDSNYWYRYQQFPGLGNNQWYMVSAWVKQANGGSQSTLQLDELGNGNDVQMRFLFDGTVNGAFTGTELVSGTLIGVAGAIDRGNGWWQIYVTNQHGSTGNVTVLHRCNQTNDGRPHVWMPMCEGFGTSNPGNVVPSLAIPTPTANVTVTRAAESCSTTDVTWVTSQLGTFYSRWTRPQQAVQNAVFSIDDGASNEIAHQWVTDADTVRYEHTGQAQLDHTAIVAGTDTRVASAHDTNDFASSANGGTSLTDATGTPIANLTTLTIGSCAEVRYFDARLSNAELEALSLDGTEPS